MKKFIFVLGIIFISIFMVSCGTNNESEKVEKPKKQEKKKKEKINIEKFGLGHIAHGKKTDSSDKKGDSVESLVTVAAVGFDEDGRIATVSIDESHVFVDYSVNAEHAIELNEISKTKKEMANDYGMKKFSKIGKEWHEQIKSLEEWMIGKTVQEIMELKVKEKEEGKFIPDDVDLNSSVTISVQDYQKAVKNAWENAEDIKSASKVGLGIFSFINSDDSKKDEIFAGIETSFAGVALDNEAKIIKSKIDVVDNNNVFNDKGKLKTDIKTDLDSKVNLGDQYGMKAFSGIKKEWYEQMMEFEDWMKGKTADEIKGLKVKKKKEDKAIPDEPDLVSSVTISIKNIRIALLKAMENAK